MSVTGVAVDLTEKMPHFYLIVELSCYALNLLNRLNLPLEPILHAQIAYKYAGTSYELACHGNQYFVRRLRTNVREPAANLLVTPTGTAHRAVDVPPIRLSKMLEELV